MTRQYLQEAFQSLNLLEEEDFELTDSGLEDMKDFMDNDEKLDFVDIIDPEAETEDELEDSYVGKVVLDCNICHSKIYKDKDALINIRHEDDKIFANEDEECPFCYSTDGFQVVGEIKPFIETEVDIEVEPKEDEIEVKEIEEEKVDVEESLKEGLLTYKETWGQVDEDPNTLTRYGLKVKKLGSKLDETEYEFTGSFDAFEKARKDGYFMSMDVEESLNEDAGQDITEYQKWVDYDMEKYHRISDDTMEKIHKAGLSVVKDQYGEYEVIADRKDESLKEDLENIDIETEHDKIHIEAEEKEDKEETIEPLSIDTVADIDDIEEKEAIENGEVEADIEDFDEESFNEIGESYLKKVYENVDSFRTSSVSNEDNALIVEGVIKFKSGKEKTTSFRFESRDTKDGQYRFLGENLQITKGKKAFTLKGSLTEGKFTPTSLRYNYQVDGNRVYGTILKEEKLSDKEGTASHAMSQKDAMAKLNDCKSAQDVAKLADSVIPEKKKNEPKVKALLKNLEQAKTLVKAQTMFTNFILKGDGLGVI